MIRDIHIRKNPDDATMKPVECGEIGVASITEAWGYYGPGGDGHGEVCRGCIAARADRLGAKTSRANLITTTPKGTP